MPLGWMRGERERATRRELGEMSLSTLSMEREAGTISPDTDAAFYASFFDIRRTTRCLLAVHLAHSSGGHLAQTEQGSALSPMHTRHLLQSLWSSHTP